MKSVISFVTAVSMMAYTCPAYADQPGNNGNGNGGCGVGQTTNGCGDTPSIPVDLFNLSADATAVAGAVAVTGDVNVRNDVRNDLRNDIRNTVRNDLTNTSSNLNLNTTQATVGDVSVGGSSATVGNINVGGSSASIGNVTTGPSTSSSNQSQSTSNSNNSTVVVQGDEAQPRNPVSSAYAAPLTSGVDTCMGSSSVGGQGVAFGLSIGTTWTDKNCVNLKNARQLQSMGYDAAAVQLMCLNRDVQKAMLLAGTPCETVKK